ncbi:integral membrane protein [Periconia macrospinosa]|uniref:Integral membrane protein n=1 Tax=Periconia macrospinosa TaxID=97972 RepID=A0A2V1DMJ3_9PLEO|nr:integral membrane protein [Periconia macrospinosa]
MGGETGPPSLSMPERIVMSGFFAIGFYNTVELFVLIFTTFKKWRGLYFWSMVVAAIGIPSHAIAFMLRYFQFAPNIPISFFSLFGWWTMVTGQSVVLWSRLHLVVHDSRKIRWVLVMIFTNASVLQVPESVLFILCNFGNPAPYITAFNIFERITIVVFSLQEAIISGLFMWEGCYSLKAILAIKRREGQNILRYLVALFILVLLLDSGLIALEYTDNFLLETACKPFVYSIKLKAELIILNKLCAFTQMSDYSCQTPSSAPVDAFRNRCISDTISPNCIGPSSLAILARTSV